MNSNKTGLAILTVVFLFLLSVGCEEQANSQRNASSDWFRQMTQLQQQGPRPAPLTTVNKGTPRINFEKVTHDFGNVSPATAHICEFNFTNTGNGVLEIDEVEQTCGCTPFELTKKEYAPGEKGSLKVGYLSDTQLGSAVKPLYVYSNDETNPEVELAIKANVIAKVDYEPKNLNLMLMQPNANCPAITIRSLDNQPFSIVSFESTNGCLSLDFNPSVQQRQFVLQPKVDMMKLESLSIGRFDIGLSHPECKTVSGTFDAPPRFSTSPRSITIYQASSQKSITKTVQVISNYNEEFEIESAVSKEGIITVRNPKKIRNGYEFELEIVPPASQDKSRVFSDVFAVNIKGAGTLEIACNGFYPGASGAYRASQKEKKCKVCGPHIIDFKSKS
jgi:hypothetical protein